jgi:hypothetical protein
LQCKMFAHSHFKKQSLQCSVDDAASDPTRNTD